MRTGHYALFPQSLVPVLREGGPQFQDCQTVSGLDEKDARLVRRQQPAAGSSTITMRRATGSSRCDNPDADKHRQADN